MFVNDSHLFFHIQIKQMMQMMFAFFVVVSVLCVVLIIFCLAGVFVIKMYI